jgi:O-antigen/teichoic acid export membrane protein
VADDLRRRSLAGFGWAFGQQAGSQLLRLVFAVLLARLLTPADYGLVGIAVLCLNFLQVLSRFGLGEGLIQHREADAALLSRLFRFHLLLSVGFCALLALVAPGVAVFFEQPALTPLLRLLALSFLLQAGTVLPRAILERELRFEAVARRALPATAFAGGLALWAAWSGWGVYSLLVLHLAEPALLALLLLPWLPRGRPAPLARLKPLLSYSWKLALAGVVGFAGKNIDTAIIGKWIGAGDLGLYQLGFRLTRLPVQNLAAVLDRVLFPAYASIRGEPERIARAYAAVLRGLSRLMLPLLAWAAASLESIVPWLLTETWHGAVPVMQIFCVLALVQTLGRGMNAVIQALGRSDVVLVWVFVAAPVNILAALAAAPRGIVAIAGALALARLLVHLGQQAVVARLLGTPLSGLLAAELAGLVPALLLLVSWAALHQAGAPSVATLLLTSAELLALGGWLLHRLGRRGAWTWLCGQ